MTNDSGAKDKRSGAQRAAALDPRAPLLVQPFKRLVEEGFIKELNVSFTPTGVTATGVPDTRMIAVKDSGLVKDQKYPLGLLASIADQGDLIPIGGKKKKKNNAVVEQPLPSKSLCARDWEFKDPSEFVARAIAVADASTGATLVGRVRSADLFGGDHTISFQKWWETASPYDRAVSLTLKKYRDELSTEQIQSLQTLRCPFRGTAEFVVSEPTPEPEARPAKASPPPKGKGKK
jgi:hypothetical protein